MALRLPHLIGWLTLMLPAAAFAQVPAGVGIGTTTPAPQAALDISASGKGLLIPRMDSATRAQIASPPTGLMVFQTDGRTGFWYAAGGQWLYLPDKARAGDNLGNHTATQPLKLNDQPLTNNGTAGLRIDNAGQVGLGTSTPSQLLELGGQVAPTLLLHGNDNGFTNGATLQFRENDLNYGWNLRHNSGGADYGSFLHVDRLVLERVNGIGLTIPAMAWDQNTGRVGIGTVDPAAQLNVQTSISADNGLLVGLAGASAAYSLKLDHNNSNLIVRPATAGGPNTVVENTAVSGSMLLNPNGGNVSIGTATSSTTQQVTMQTTSATENGLLVNLTGASTAQSLKLDHNGSNLIVRPYAAGGTSTVVENTASGGSMLLNPNGGNVGVGLNLAPADIQLQVQASSDTENGLYVGLYGASAAYSLKLSHGSSNLVVRPQAAGSVSTVVENTASGGYLLLNPTAGNVGIGTTAPTQRLDVGGSARISGSALINGSVVVDNAGTAAGTWTTTAPALRFGSATATVGLMSKRTSGGNQNGLDLFTAGTARLSISSGGKVGIGTSTPKEALDVTGNARATGGVFATALISQSYSSSLGPNTSADNQMHLVNCTTTGAITSVNVYATSHLDGYMQINCANLTGILSPTGETWVDGPGVGADNQFHRVSCPDGTIASSWRIRATGDYLDGDMGLLCRPLNAGYSRGNPFVTAQRWGGYNVDTSDAQFQGSACPPGTFVTEVNIYAGSQLEVMEKVYCAPIITN